ncbi:uncharacterized protein LOC114650893 isoform X2 [Erpetoichthys calabaricus]|uniref:uncharacterized protein LOC114650893 isoform X2 n=1 Tax=Erpetoichthys calabaricus TaxID=27687 RepID=UPI00223428AC|nr:uncharacterized protein LOC114650893 isoform X2 [Erpetoichthys calabaricus]
MENSTSKIQQEMINDFGKSVTLICTNLTWHQLLMEKWTISNMNEEKCYINVTHKGRMSNNCTTIRINTSKLTPYLYIPSFQPNDVGSYSCETLYSGGKAAIQYYLWGIYHVNKEFGKNVSLNCSHQKSGEIISENWNIRTKNYTECVISRTRHHTLNNTCNETKEIFLYFKQDQSHLQITNFQDKNEGNYTCERRHQAGLYKAVFILSGPSGKFILKILTIAGFLAIIVIGLVLLRHPETLNRGLHKESKKRKKNNKKNRQKKSTCRFFSSMLQAKGHTG